MADSGEVSRLLRDWAAGNEAAKEQVVPLVYDALRRLAAKYLASESHVATIQPTALVHEAYMRLDQGPPDWQSRNHFFGVAARIMRQILVDAARVRLAQKRGAGAIHVELSAASAITLGGPDSDVIALSTALDELEKLDPQRAKIIDLRYFGGLTEAETALSLNLSDSKIRRETRLAEAWLYTRMQAAPEA